MYESIVESLTYGVEPILEQKLNTFSLFRNQMNTGEIFNVP